MNKTKKKKTIISKKKKTIISKEEKIIKHIIAALELSYQLESGNPYCKKSILNRIRRGEKKLEMAGEEYNDLLFLKRNS